MRRKKGKPAAKKKTSGKTRSQEEGLDQVEPQVIEIKNFAQFRLRRLPDRKIPQ
jgi:hypothetical protein